ncbi:MAG TPA: hypothetical protein VFR19_17710 [Hyphomicrobiaceae bacterium]|nr:hypothetical protein [Hyphomicrobiaceae bacterium]
MFFVWTWVLMLGGLSNLGLSTAVLRLLPLHRERNEHAALRGLLLGGRLLVLSVASAIALAGLALLWCLGERVATPYAVPAYLGLICIPIVTLTDLQDGVARARGLTALGLLPPYVLRPLLLIAGLGAAHLYSLPVNARFAIAAAILASLGAAIVQTLLLRHRLQRELAPGPRRYAIALWFKTALPFWLIVACDLTLQNADVLVISSYLGPAEVGMYFAAAKTMSLVLFIPYAVASAMANRIAALDARGEEAGLRAAVADAANWIFWPSLLAGAAIPSGRQNHARPVRSAVSGGLPRHAHPRRWPVAARRLRSRRPGAQHAGSGRRQRAAARFVGAAQRRPQRRSGPRLRLGWGRDGGKPRRRSRQLRPRQTPAQP